MAQHGGAPGPEARGLPTDWHRGADANAVEARLKKDKAHDIKAVCVVHNETSTGARTWIDEIRKAMDVRQASGLDVVRLVLLEAPSHGIGIGAPMPRSG